MLGFVYMYYIKLYHILSIFHHDDSIIIGWYQYFISFRHVRVKKVIRDYLGNLNIAYFYKNLTLLIYNSKSVIGHSLGAKVENEMVVYPACSAP